MKFGELESTSSVQRSRRAALGLLALCVVLSGCKQEVHCQELGDCGGADKLGGDWELRAGGSSCLEDLYNPPTDNRFARGDQLPARVPLPEPAVYDWCDLLVANGAENILSVPPLFYAESAPVGAATVRYNADGTFSAGLTRSGTFILDFPAVCMRSFGAMDNRPAYIEGMLQGPPLQICKQLEVKVRESGVGEGAYPNATCEINPADPQGCLCAFDSVASGGPVGTYQVVDGNTIVHYSNNAQPRKVTFCSDGSNLQLTGKDGEYLFGVVGLRTLSLSKAVAAP